ncbi:ATP-dependent zinc metalloprotease FtsH [Geotalea uraniireducens]|uniref:ATP-dependent zinc metalloprotease FtsH n=1 Tax=Geotalea uraniireducens (strain Rf4) TaxID=351605 RepID=A5G540_GEOUR|nr:ATP-dependent zinc metalloprotease FtsH [Geotalea uraniireducens]ABQ26908.1 membrane protease FtsH catalytic subunit [Geotalea uraniireducens Rf4]
MNQFYKNLALWLVISLMMILLFNLFNKPKPAQEKLDYSDFIEAVETGKIKNVDKKVVTVTIQGNEILGKFSDGKDFRSYKPADANLSEKLLAQKIAVNARPEEEKFSWFSIFISWFPIIFLVGVWIFFMRQMQGGGGKAMAFGKSRAKLLTETQGKITFEDVAGIEEAKEELEEIISFLKEPKKFTKLGGRIPKGVLLMGPPGTGKTLLARAIAGEAGVPFFSISGSDFVEMFVGVGASRVRDLFVQGKKSAPCIIFIDEIDAVGRHRGAGLGGGHDEREQTLNQLLVEMDGFESNEGVILIAATNRPDVLDPALLRPGRFDRQVVVPRPDVKGREAILKVHTKKTPLGANIDLAVIARGTPGFSGADLSNVVNEAALLAARKDKSVVDMQDFDDAKDKVLMGVERRSMVISDEEKKNTAYHEAGHTLVAKLIPGTDPVHKVSIIPRGRALGVTMQLPIEDKHSYSRESLLDRIAVLMGGRAAEEIIFNSMTTGAGNDIERATEIARKMVCEWGMSEKMGPVSFGKKDEQIFLGREMSTHKNYSEATAVDIDAEIKRIVEENYIRVRRLLTDNVDVLHRLSHELIEKENLSGEEVDRIINVEASVTPTASADEVAPA